MKVSFKQDKIVLSTRNKITYHYTVKDRYRLHGKMNVKDKKVKIFNKPNKFTYEFPIGYTFFLLNMLHDQMDPSDVASIKDHFKSNLADSFDYMHLYEHQQDDLRTLLKWKRGTFQCYTGYGKSEVIMIMVLNFLRLGMKVLVITPNNPSAKELRDRFKNKAGLKSPKTFDPTSQLNVINPISLLASNLWEKLGKSDYSCFHDIDVVIADEVEMTLNNSFFKIHQHLRNCQYFYGFSATANKLMTKPIRRDKGLLKQLNSQLDTLVGVYGFTAVYQLPIANKITIHTLHTNLTGYKFFKESDSKSEYAALVTDLMSYKGFQLALKKILDQVPNLFLPINNLGVIKSLIDANLTDKPIMTIQGSGNHIYENGQRVRTVSLDEAKRIIAANEVHFILGTSSSFRALDFRTLNNILCTFGKLTSVCIQYVGRVAREIEMNIWYINSAPKVKIYSNTINRNQRMVEDFYKNCDINYKEHYMIE